MSAGIMCPDEQLAERGHITHSIHRFAMPASHVCLNQVQHLFVLGALVVGLGRPMLHVVAINQCLHLHTEIRTMHWYAINLRQRTRAEAHSRLCQPTLKVLDF